MEHLSHASVHEDIREEDDLPSDPPEEEEDGEAGDDEPESAAAEQVRYEADRRIKQTPEIQAHILAFYVEGVPRGEIAKSLEKFGLTCGKGIAALQTANLLAQRAATNLTDIRPQREEARQYIVEKLPHLAWRLLPRSRAFLAHCLDETRAPLKLIAETSDAYMKTIGSNLPGASDTALSDLLNAEKGGGSREGLARYFRIRPHKLTDVQLQRAKEEVETRFGEQFKRQESLSRFKSDWILDDLNRSLLVALLDLGEEKARPSAVAWAVAKSIPKSGVTLSFIVINQKHYGGYKEFADAVRVGTESIAPGLKTRAEELIAEYNKKVETGKTPEWRQAPEQKAFLCFLLQETELSTDMVSWAHTARFAAGESDPVRRKKLSVGHSALKEYIRSRDGNEAYATELRAQIGDDQLRAAAAIDLTKLPGYAELTPQKRRTLDAAMVDSFKPMQRIVEKVKRRETSSVPRVNLRYGRSTMQEERDGRTVPVTPRGGLTEMLAIDFLPSVPKGSDEKARIASDNALKLRQLLLKELQWISEQKTRKTGGSVSILAEALIDAEKTGTAIRTVVVTWTTYDSKGQPETGHARFQLNRFFIDAVRDLERTLAQRKEARDAARGEEENE